MTYVVLPQAVRNVLPDLIVQHAGGGEAHLARQRGGRARTAVPGPPGAERDLQRHADRHGRAVIYFLMLWPVVRLLSRLENRQLTGQR